MRSASRCERPIIFAAPSGGAVGADRVELQQDEKVQSGGAIIETTHGQVDAPKDLGTLHRDVEVLDGEEGGGHGAILLALRR